MTQVVTKSSIREDAPTGCASGWALGNSQSTGRKPGGTAGPQAGACGSDSAYPFCGMLHGPAPSGRAVHRLETGATPVCGVGTSSEASAFEGVLSSA